MKLKEFINDLEKYKQEEFADTILKKYNFAINKIINRYNEYYKNKEYAKPFIDELNKKK